MNQEDTAIYNDTASIIVLQHNAFPLCNYNNNGISYIKVKNASIIQGTPSFASNPSLLLYNSVLYYIYIDLLYINAFTQCAREGMHILILGVITKDTIPLLQIHRYDPIIIVQ